MSKKRINSSKLFLTELIISIFFFIMVTAICIQLFADAHVMSMKSENLTQAVNAAANVAECYSVWDWQEASWDVLYPRGSWEGSVWKMFYDESWTPCLEGGSYLVQMNLVGNGDFREAHIEVTDMEGQEIYSLKVKRIWVE